MGGQILLAGLSDESHDVGRHRRVRIVASLYRLDVQLGKGYRLRLDRGHLRHRQIFGDGNWAGVGDYLTLLEARFDLLRLHAEDLGEKHDHLLTMRRVELDDRTHEHPVEAQRVGGLVVGQDLLSAPVEDQAALGRQDDLPERVRLGEVPILLRLYSLDEPERACQENEDDDDRPQKSVDAEGQELLVITVDAHGKSEGRRQKADSKFWTFSAFCLLLFDHHPAGRRVASIGSSRRNSVRRRYTIIPKRQVKIVFTIIPCSNISTFCFNRMFTRM